MALLVDLAQVQAWLEPTKTRIDTFPTEQAEYAQAMTFGKLRTVFETVDDWADTTTAPYVPELVRDAIAMWTAGLTFNKFYSQQSTSFAAYGNILIARANDIIEGLIDGTLVIDEELPRKDKGLPAFWPTARTEEGPVFTMGGKL